MSKVILNVQKNGNDPHNEIILNVRMQTFKGITNSTRENIPVVLNLNISKTQIKENIDRLIEYGTHGVFIIPSNKTNGNSMEQTDNIKIKSCSNVN